MKLKDLLSALQTRQFFGDEQIEISSIIIHSQDAGPGTLFVAIPGEQVDGHDFLDDVYAAGTRVFVTQRPFQRSGAANIVVPDCRDALPALAARLFEQPSRDLTLIGITGTNGKTTTAFLIEAILQEAGLSVGVLGTVTYRFGRQRLNAERTTPDALGLQLLLRQMVDEGVRYAIMEVSSHGLAQRRVAQVDFDIAVFTNLTPEHLDYHKTMDDYFISKRSFFTDILARSAKSRVAAVINQDDRYGRELIAQTPSPVLRYGRSSGDISAANVELSLDGIAAEIQAGQQRIPIRSRLIGEFNLYNILAAVGACWFLHIPPATIKAGVEKTAGVPGRMERVENDRGILIFVDYAHTGDALENVLTTLRQTGAERIITIFGCGGDRDRTKRPVMGSVAAQYSSVLIVTSDNPRSENPESIIAEIEAGVRLQGMCRVDPDNGAPYAARAYCVVPDRRTAIRLGISLARPGDVVLIAGKGHENYQQIGDRKIAFDDREEARRALEACG
jgi:UDP-N-acetylmuramoyl-L-alanyl-D-glutamate--2,6-diaminopimelate ligase